jgi:PAS domain S-box-containing protein
MAEHRRSQKEPAIAPGLLINGDGVMANLIRAHDWSATPLGPIEGWSETLIATVNMALHSPFPTIVAWGPEMVFLYNDAGIPTLAGKHPAALGGFYRDVFREAWDLVKDDLEACLLRGETPVRDNMYIPILLNGILEEHYWSYSLIPVYEGGRIAGFYDAYRNMTEIVMGARRLRESEARLKLATEVAELGIYVWHLNEDRGSWDNERMYQIFGRTSADGLVNGASFIGDVVHPDFAEAFQKAVEATSERGDPFYFEGMIRRKDDAFSWIEVHGQLEIDADGVRKRILGTIRDVTRIKQSEEALRTAEKLSAVGRLAASIAHEINNPLASVTNLLYLARTSANLQEIHGFLDIAERELRRVSAISNQTLRFYRQTTKPMDCRCDELFDSILSVYQGRLVNSGIEVLKRMRANRPLNCFEGEIRQVLTNLVGNAIDAMPATGGRLLVRSRESTNWRTGKKGLTLTVADTGRGMSKSVLKQIFQPFFTTKGIGGTGLGLWVSADIVKRHHGRLLVRSRQQEGRSGAVFALFLPFDGLDPSSGPPGAAETS